MSARAGQRRQRRWIAAALAALAGTLATLQWHPAAATAARVVTWTADPVANSRFVDPGEAPAGSYNEPPGVEERPNALRAKVFLPDGYRRDRERRYPVLFLLHGQGDAYDSWANPQNGDLRDVVGDFPGFIVMPEADRGFYANWWNGGRRGDPAWERYHLDQLVPYVMRRLPVRRGRRWHAIAGLSMGGEGAVFYASQRPGFFGTAASFSGPLSIRRPTYQNAFDFGTGQSHEAIFGDFDAQDFYWRGHDPTELVDNLADTRLYVAAGDGTPDPARPDEASNTFGQLAERELGMQAAEFADAAKEQGAPVTYRPHRGIHDWPYWRQDLADAIEWGLFERPPRPGRSWAYETVARRGEMHGLRFRFAKPPSELIRFERDGRRLKARGSGNVSVGGGDCRFSADLPFERRLRRGC